MKRVLSFVLACMVLMSASVFAAEPVTYTPAEDGTYSIGYTEGTAEKYYSLVVVEGKYAADATPVISEESVLYIDQATADANGDVTFNGWVPKNEEAATVYLGGTGADKPVLLGYLSAANRIISGTVLEIPETAKEATVTLTSGGDTYTVTTANGAYSVNVPDGKYTVKVEIDNYLSYEESDFTVDGTDVSKNVSLLGGDVNDDGAINGADITKLVNGGSYGADCDIDGDGVVDFDDLMVVLNNYGKTVAAEEAKTAPEVVYELTEVSSGTYKVVATLTDTEDDFRGWKNIITYDSSIITPVADSFVAYSGATVVTETVTENGDESKIVFESYVTPGSKDATNVTVFEMQFTLADGKTTDDFISETFKVDYVAYANGEYNYYGTTDANITVANNVVPNATVITVPVIEGDIVYLQNGTVAVAETTGDYQVLNKLGYVAVNTDNVSQKTYYINGITATEVHTNGTVAQNAVSLRANGSGDVDENNKLRNGVRFKMGHNPSTRAAEDHEVTEVGFLMTALTSKVTSVIGKDPVLTIDMIDTGRVKKGIAYSTVTKENKAFDTDDDTFWIISGVFYGIPTDVTEMITAEDVRNNVHTEVVCRPYYIVNGKAVYGEQKTATLYDVAYTVKNTEALWNDCADKAYVEDILAKGELDNEVIINISHLYPQN